MKELLLGCGSDKRKRLFILAEGDTEEWGDLTTLDRESSHNPDVVWDLEKRPLPFEDESFDRVHAYEVLEHIGKQGDWRGFFEEFSEYWRILKNGGFLLGTVPKWNSMAAWGDPSHTRIFTPMTFTFLSQEAYERDIGKTVMTDFRSVWKGDFKPVFYEEEEDTFRFVLKKGGG